MRRFPAAALLVLLLVPAALASAPYGEAAGWGPGAPALDKNDDLIAEFENPDERAAALAKIQELGRKVPSKLKTYFMRQVVSPDAGVSEAAMDAVVSIGKSMRKPLKLVLTRGEYKGAAIPAPLAARMALRIDPTGESVVAPYLEEQTLESGVAAEICRYAEPGAALQMLSGKAVDEASRGTALTALRRLRSRNAFAEIKDVAAVVKEQAPDLGDPLTQVLVDAATHLTMEKDGERMSAWLTSKDPASQESALWSIGSIGQDSMDLAPLLGPHLISDSPTVREAAHWALRRMTGPGDADEREDDPGIAAAAEATPSGAADPEGTPTPVERLTVLREAKGGVLSVPAEESSSAAARPAESEPAKRPRRPAPGPDATPYWRFAPRWLTALGADFKDPQFASHTPSWERVSLPGPIEELMPTLLAALEHEDSAISTPAGLSLIEWNVSSREVLLWAASVVGTETDAELLRPVWALLVRESENRMLRAKPIAEAFKKALRDQSVEVSTIKLLEEMDTALSRDVLVNHYAISSSSRPWDIQHYLTLYSLMVRDLSARKKVMTVVGRRFLAGDYLVSPLLVLAGEASHPTLESALASSVLDRRMVALAVIMAQGEAARTMLKPIRKLVERDPAAKAFRRETIKVITGEE